MKSTWFCQKHCYQPHVVVKWLRIIRIIKKILCWLSHCEKDILQLFISNINMTKENIFEMPCFFLDPGALYRSKAMQTTSTLPSTVHVFQVCSKCGLRFLWRVFDVAVKLCDKLCGKMAGRSLPPNIYMQICRGRS